MIIYSLEVLKNELIKIYDHDSEDYKEVYINLVHYVGKDWKDYVKVQDDYYHRDVYYSCDKFDMVIITWGPGQKCPIHNHPVNGCFVKLLRGSITEERYEPFTLKKTKEATHIETHIFYIDDSFGYHKMSNLEKNPCVSLHIYAPGNYKPVIFEETAVQ
jgi:cysteine dioxygenase